MEKTKLKFCGFTNKDDITYAINLGVDYIGIITEYPQSARSMKLKEIEQMKLNRLENKIEFVCVLVNPKKELIDKIYSLDLFKVIQFHGGCEPQEIFEYAKEKGFDVWVAIKNDEYFRTLNTQHIDLLLLDDGYAKEKTKGIKQSNPVDPKSIGASTKIGLAGGLNSENLEEKLGSDFDLVDVSSGIETLTVGKKSKTKMKKFKEVFDSLNKYRDKPFIDTSYDADPDGYFSSNNQKFGGRYAPEMLIPALDELKDEYTKQRKNRGFQQEFIRYLREYCGRPTPLTYAENLTKQLGGAKIFLKNEGLNHTGAHKMNHCIGQILLAKRMGKTRIIAETGAGQHGVATATVAAKFGMECVVYMGEVDYMRQRPNVFWMEKLGATVVPVTHGSRRLKDAVTAALQDWITNVDSSYYLLGSALGPDPYPSMVRDFQTIVGLEIKKQFQEQVERDLPDYVVACVGGGSNAIGAFNIFLDEPVVKLIGVEAGGRTTNKIGEHASRFANRDEMKIGVVEGYKSYFLQDSDGQIQPTHSISAGLDYSGVGPQHAKLFNDKRVQYESVSDKEVLEAFELLAQTEGLIGALESLHAVAHTIKIAPQLSAEECIVVNLSGRGDKDIFILADALGDKNFNSYIADKAKESN